MATTGSTAGRFPADGRGLFLLRFLLFWGLGVALVALLPVVERVSVQATVSSLAAVLRSFGARVVVEGSIITAGDAALAIVPDCTPVGPLLVLWAAFLAYPGAWSRRLLALVISVPVLWLLNLARVASLLGVLSLKPEAFEPIHSLLWQPVTLLAVLALFAFWVRIEGRRSA